MRRIRPKHQIALDNLLLASTQRQTLAKFGDLVVPQQTPEGIDVVGETVNAVDEADEEIVEFAVEAAVDGEAFCLGHGSEGASWCVAGARMCACTDTVADVGVREPAGLVVAGYADVAGA